MTEPATRDAPERLLTAAEVCEQLGIGRTKLYELRQDGHLPPIKLPSRTDRRPRLRWRQSTVRDFIAAQA